MAELNVLGSITSSQGISASGDLFCDNIFYLVNGHAVWHIGTALGMFFGFMTFLI